MSEEEALREVAEKLRAERARLGMSQEALAKAAGLPFESYKKYELAKSMPGGDALVKLARAGVNINQVLGIDPTWRPALKPSVAREEAPGYGYVKVPLYDIKASAGHGRELTETPQVVSELAFREEWIRGTLHATPDDLGLFYVEGDSGEPDLHSGDICLYNRRDVTAKREGIYLIRMGDALLIKQLQRLPGSVLKVSSRNPAYTPYEIPLNKLDDPEAFSIIGRVVWVCRRL